jgi:hypothetical protein
VIDYDQRGARVRKQCVRPVSGTQRSTGDSGTLLRETAENESVSRDESGIFLQVEKSPAERHVYVSRN